MGEMWVEQRVGTKDFLMADHLVGMKVSQKVDNLAYLWADEKAEPSEYAMVVQSVCELVETMVE